MRKVIIGKGTLDVIVLRVLNLEEKLLRGESLSKEEDEKLAQHLGILKFRDNQDRLQRIKEFYFSVKKAYKKLKEIEEQRKKKK